MADQVIGITIKGIGDFSDVVSNVNSVQRALTKLKIPDKLGNNLTQNISNFMREYDRYQQKLAGGIKTQGDNNAVNRSLSSMLSSYQKIVNDFNKIKPKDFKELFKLDEGAFAAVSNKIKNIQVELDKIKLDPSKITGPLEQIRGLTKSNKIVGSDGLLNTFQNGLTSGGVDGLVKAREALTELENHYARFQSQMTRTETKTGWTDALRDMRIALEGAEQKAAPLITSLTQVEQKQAQIGAEGVSAFNGMQQGLNGTVRSAENVVSSLQKIHNEEFGFNRQVQMIDRQVQSYFGLSQMIRKVGNIAKSAFNTVKELDQAMTATAVVTNFNIGDMWEMLPAYTAQANQLGSTIKDVYDAATLYYQQGLNQNQAMGLANETLKMARIAGMDAAEATDMMTAALRGFNMEINQVSAQRINDVYSKLAAITASNTQELGTAMEKTASLANSANMDFETTSAFLAQMIETTREAPENLGTAMKTIVARFQEMKQDPTKLVDSEGVAMDVNKVDTALKTIGVSLTNTKGEFRDLDDVFLEIASKWDSLSQGQQRYIATTAAGSRQQSRFIAMMSNYDRTMELVEEANNSAGASQKQFEKTMDSMSSKLNQLKNAWNQFTMGLMNNKILKAGVDGLTGFFSIVNKIIDTLSRITGPMKGFTKSFLTLGATLTGLNFAKNLAHGSIAAGAGWWNGKGGLFQNFKQGYGEARSNKSVIADNKYDQMMYNQMAKMTSGNGSYGQGFQVNAPVTVSSYLEKVDASSLPEEVKEQIRKLLEGKVKVEDIPAEVNTVLAKTRTQADTSTREGAKIASDAEKLIVDQGAVDSVKKFDKMKGSITGVSQSLTTMGLTMQRVGTQIGGPFGAAIAGIGSAMSILGTTIGAVTASFNQNLNAALADATGKTIDEAATIGLTGANLGLAASTKLVIGAIGKTIGMYLAIAAAVVAVVVIYKALDKAIETNKERMERFTNAAKTASEAYSSLKQESSELNSALEQVKSNEEAFKGLVVGTAEFNEKLIEANHQINELLQKYPELNNPKYLSTDENGLMHINEKGINFIKEQQAQRVGNASALNILQSARLKAEEDRQKAEKSNLQAERITDPLYGNPTAAINNVKLSRALTAEEAKKVAKLKEESKYYEDNAENAERLAKQQAISNSLTGIEASKKDKIAGIYADTYDTALKQAQVEAANVKLEDKKKAYADFYGYNYDAISKKMTDINGEEVKIDDSVIKDAFPQITVLADMEINGESLEKMQSTIDSKFAKGIGVSSKESTTLLTDILSRNADTNADAINKVLKDPSKIEEAIKNLSNEERAALLNITQEEFSSDIKGYTEQLVEKAKSGAEDVHKIQEQSQKDLVGMIAQSQSKWGLKNASYSETKAIEEEIKGLKADQVNLLSTVGKSLEENVGAETMKKFIGSAKDVYLGKDKEAQKELTNILSNTQWDSATSRLTAYTKMANSNTQTIKEMGQEMRTAASESNLLGESFDEFLGGDWTEISENIDDFKNATGEIDSTGIIKMSEQSSQLKALLDSGEVSASGLAKTLNAIDDGSISRLSDTALRLLSSLDKLTDKAREAHNIIEKFDAGIDTGEGEDFVKENAKKAQEYYSNGEWGNEQLQNYIKLAAGEERWNQALRKNKGDLEGTTKSLMKYVNTFKDGFGPAWDQITSKKSITGESFEKRLKDLKKENKDLADRFEEAQVKFFYDKEGYLDFNIGDLTTDELEAYFQEIYGVSKEYASLLMQDLKNYDGTLSAELKKNDLKAVTNDSEFQKSHTDVNGNIALAGSDLRAYRDAGGDMEALAKDLGYGSVSEMWKNDFKTTKNGGEERTNYPKLFQEYTEKFYGKNDDLFNAFRSGYKQFDVSGMMEDALVKGMSDTQSLNSAFEAYKAAQDKGLTTTYNGMSLEGGLETVEDFEAAISSMTESSQWVQVGETIGQQIVSAMNNADFLDKLHNNPEDLEPALNDEGKFNQDAFVGVLEQLKISGENEKQQKNDITTYLSQSREAFEKLSSEDQAKFLQDAVSRLSEYKFNSEDIASVLRDGLGVKFGRDGGGALVSNEKGQVSLDIENAKTILENQLKDVPATFDFGDSVENLQKNLKNLKADVAARIISIGYVKTPGLATGQNNPNSAFHQTGTMARGSRGGYTISGRPTLTGEEGEELVWEPKRNEAYMVGSNGPQFANISKDAVVWNADQTRRIKKNSGSVGRVGTGARGITPVGTMAGGMGGTGGLKIPGTGTMDIVGNVIETIEPAVKPTVSVIGKLEFGEQEKGNPLGKLLGGNKQGPTVKAFVEASSLKVSDEAKKIKGIEGSISKIEKNGQVSGEPVKLSGVVTNVTTKTTQPKQQKQTKQQTSQPKNTTSTHTVQTKATNTAQNAINAIKPKLVRIPTAIDNGAQKGLNALKSKVPHLKVPITANFTGPWIKSVKITKAATGKNNHIQYHSAPTFGSAARGPYGTVGPKNRGGLTLTGEKGYEVAWLPSENRSMILGVGGPQMITLPEDAVVYTHEQSKDILKRKSIDAGSSRTGRRKTTSSSKSKNSKSKSKSKSSKKSSSKKGTGSSKDEANVAAISNIVVWWENITRLADAAQRRADKNQKTYEKYLKELQATLKTTGTTGGGNAFIDNTRKAIKLYTDQLNQAIKELTNLDKGTAAQQAKKKNANKDAFNAEEGGAVQISYSKGGKKKKTVNKTVATAGYIKEQDGTYIIDQAALNKVKNKEERKALRDALNKEINDRISKKNTAEDNIEKAQEALEKFSEELYNTFFAWENELTKIWNITQKIEQAESRMSRNDAFEELLKAQLSTGKLTAGAASKNKDLTNFRSKLETQNQLLKDRQDAITANQQNLQSILNSTDVNKALADVKSRLNADAQATQKANKKASLEQAQKAKATYDDAVKNRETTQANLDKVQEKIDKLNKKKKLSKAQKKELKNLKTQRDNLKKQISDYNKTINDNTALANQVNKLQQEYNEAASGIALNETQREGYKRYKEELEKQISAEDMGRRFIKTTKRADGTIDIQFDTEAFENERLNGNIGSEMAKAVQDWVKKLQEASSNLQKTYEELTKEVTDYYTQLESLQDEWANYGKELTEISETYEKEKIDKIKQLSDAVKESLNKLLDDVKRKLDERRKQEENAKTEQDISQKQQRLAALRADTSGGNQVEIAKLEKEISEAQQSYQTSLEDQLLDKLQQQADLAAEQRERQIELQETLVDSVNNIEKVNEWMANPEAFGEEIRAAYYSKNEYDEVTKAEREQIETEFNEFYNGLITNQRKQDELNTTIESIESIITQIEGYLKQQNQTLTTAKQDGYTAAEAQKQFNASLSELRTEGKYTVNDFQKSNYSGQQIKQAGFGASDFKSGNISYAEAKAAGYSLDELEKGGYAEATAEKAALAAKEAVIDPEAAEKATKQANYDAYINKLKEVKKIKPASVKSSDVDALFDLGEKAGYGKASVLLHLVGDTGGSDPFTWKNIFKAILDANGIDRYNLVKTWPNGDGSLADAIKTLKSNPNTYAEIKKHKNYKSATALKFASGGLANYTGPAWLDGTPSKPELVLNSTDTRNFIALRDILSKAIGSTNSNNNSYANSEFNININVDKVANDYDVDRIITKVKKEIVRSAGYRNVAQVRNFR